MTLNKLSLAVFMASTVALSGCSDKDKSNSNNPAVAQTSNTAQQEKSETKRKTVKQLINGIDRYLGYSEHNKHRKRILTNNKVLEVAVAEEAPRAVMLKPEHIDKVLNSEPAVTAFAKNKEAFAALMADTTARNRFLNNQNAVSIALKEENARNTLTSVDDNIDDAFVLETVLEATAARTAILASEDTRSLIEEDDTKFKILLDNLDANHAYRDQDIEKFNAFAKKGLEEADDSNADQALKRVFGSADFVYTNSLNDTDFVKAAIRNSDTREQLLAANGPYFETLVGQDSFNQEVLASPDSVTFIVNNPNSLATVLNSKANALAASKHFITAAKTANADSMKLLLENDSTRSTILNDISKNPFGSHTSIIAAATKIASDSRQNQVSLEIIRNLFLDMSMLSDSQYLTTALANPELRSYIFSHKLHLIRPDYLTEQVFTKEAYIKELLTETYLATIIDKDKDDELATAIRFTAALNSMLPTDTTDNSISKEAVIELLSSQSLREKLLKSSYDKAINNPNALAAIIGNNDALDDIVGYENPSKINKLIAKNDLDNKVKNALLARAVEKADDQAFVAKLLASNLKDDLLKNSTFVTKALKNRDVRELLVTDNNLQALSEAVDENSKPVIFSHQQTVEKIFGDATLIAKLDAADINNAKFSTTSDGTNLYHTAITTAANSIDTYNKLKDVLDLNRLNLGQPNSILATIVLDIDDARRNALDLNDNSIREEIFNAAFASRTSRTVDAPITSDPNFPTAATHVLGIVGLDSKAFVTDLIGLYQDEATALTSKLFNDSGFVNAVWDKDLAKNHVLQRINSLETPDANSISQALKNKIEADKESLKMLGKANTIQLGLDAAKVSEGVDLQKLLESYNQEINAAKAEFTFYIRNVDTDFINFHIIERLNEILNTNAIKVKKSGSISDFTTANASDLTYQWSNTGRGEGTLTIWLHDPSITEIKIPAKSGFGLADSGVTIRVGQEIKLGSTEITQHISSLKEKLNRLFNLKTVQGQTITANYNFKPGGNIQDKNDLLIALQNGLITIKPNTQANELPASDFSGLGALFLQDTLNTQCGASLTTCEWTLKRSSAPSDNETLEIKQSDDQTGPDINDLVKSSGIFDISTKFFATEDVTMYKYYGNLALSTDNSFYDTTGFKQYVESITIYHKNENIKNINPGYRLPTLKPGNSYGLIYIKTSTYDATGVEATIEIAPLSLHQAFLTSSANPFSSEPTQGRSSNIDETIIPATHQYTYTAGAGLEIKAANTLTKVFSALGQSATLKKVEVHEYDASAAKGLGDSVATIDYSETETTVKDGSSRNIDVNNPLPAIMEATAVKITYSIKDVNNNLQEIVEVIYLEPK
jgi:hypothetical protein